MEKCEETHTLEAAVEKFEESFVTVVDKLMEPEKVISEEIGEMGEVILKPNTEINGLEQENKASVGMEQDKKITLMKLEEPHMVEKVEFLDIGGEVKFETDCHEVESEKPVIMLSQTERETVDNILQYIYDKEKKVVKETTPKCHEEYPTITNNFEYFYDDDEMTDYFFKKKQSKQDKKENVVHSAKTVIKHNPILKGGISKKQEKTNSSGTNLNNKEFKIAKRVRIVEAETHSKKNEQTLRTSKIEPSDEGFKLQGCLKKRNTKGKKENEKENNNPFLGLWTEPFICHKVQKPKTTDHIDQKSELDEKRPTTATMLWSLDVLHKTTEDYMKAVKGNELTSPLKSTQSPVVQIEREELIEVPAKSAKENETEEQDDNILKQKNQWTLEDMWKEDIMPKVIMCSLSGKSIRRVTIQDPNHQE